MKPVVTVIDYGSGNLFSVRRALEHCGADVEVSGDPAAIAAAEKLLLPGVGAFADGMRGLTESGLAQVVINYAATGRPLLGICLGMQMLASASEEFGEHPGLSIIPGKVVAIPATGSDGRAHKIPHIGWSSLALPHGLSNWDNTLLQELQPGDAVYLVHSYYLEVADAAHRLADCYYHGRRITAAVRKGNIYGCQFHPEKSGAVGLSLLKQFIAINV